MRDYSMTLTLTVTGLQSEKHAQYVAEKLAKLATSRGYKNAAVSTTVTKPAAAP